MMTKIKNKIVLITLTILILVGVIGIVFNNKKINKEKDPEPEPVVVSDTGIFTIDLLKRINKEENYLISPYSIEMALNMLRSGANGKTKDEIDNILLKRDLYLPNNNVKISNALFIKDMYKSVIEAPFENELKNKYNSKVLYDEFKTPKVINDWVKDSTDGMIEKILDDIDPDFVLGLANAIAIDAKWVSEFECSNTVSEKFDVSSSKSMNVEMMHKIFRSGAKYLDDGEFKGVILPYQESLEFIALLPKENLKNHINNLTNNELDNILTRFEDATNDRRLALSLPRFSYEYSIKDFMGILKDMGIKKAFDEEEADFSKIITKENLNELGKENIYVSDAIHKTYIDLNEKGTKAAAVTYFGIRATSGIESYETVEIKFDRPFIYMIRDTETKEILFLGSVYEPNNWNGNTCEKSN